MSMKDSIIPHIRDCKTSTDTWKTPNDLYKIKNTNQIIFLKSKLLSIKMVTNDFVNAFVARIKELKGKLGDIGETISSTDLVTITLNGMLEDY